MSKKLANFTLISLTLISGAFPFFLQSTPVIAQNQWELNSLDKILPKLQQGYGVKNHSTNSIKNTTDDFEKIRALVIKYIGSSIREAIEVRPILIVENYALASYSNTHTGGQVLLKLIQGQWLIIKSDGGSMQDTNYLMQLGVPRNIAVELAAGPDI